MNDTQKTRIFADLYITALRAATKNQWLQSPKEGTEKWTQLEAARKMVEELGGEYGAYIRVQFAALQRFSRVPAPHHLCSKNAVQRYIIHQKMKNTYYRPYYSVEGEDFIVNATGKRYPIKQADLPIQQDPDASYAQWLAKEGTIPQEREKAIVCMEYGIAKLRYKEKVPTDAMLRMLRRLKEEQ